MAWFWGTSTDAWLFLCYRASSRLLDSNPEPAAKIVNGTWLLLTAEAQSLAVTARLFFIHINPSAITPPYSINMGAIASTALAASHLALLRTIHPQIR
ncbi:MAG: hypothetical protein M1596_03260 [Firmicutes bacterium]|nr:hypothetical protein [Bacillota bacterium]